MQCMYDFAKVESGTSSTNCQACIKLNSKAPPKKGVAPSQANLNP